MLDMFQELRVELIQETTDDNACDVCVYCLVIESRVLSIFYRVDE
jgi:hypothetical protein